ncbi:nuclear transport factor 2 family protein [Sphingomonas sp.]|uniref:nuclear transport factor 2 family protein n=1 Tax=Sphingomonas sp. TaxID=28214 RepID=UPI0039C8E369
MRPLSRLPIIERLMDRYNARDADGYADMFAVDGCEANYRGDVVREGREGVRAGMAKVFEQFPENRADVLQQFELGDRVVLHERVYRSADAEPFDVMTVYSFSGDEVSRVEFIR